MYGSLEDLAYVLGAFLGDGSAEQKAHSGCAVAIRCCDKEIITRCYFAVHHRYNGRFKGMLKEHPPAANANLEQYGVTWYNKEFYELVIEFVGDYKLRLPYFIWSATRECQLSMLAGLFDTDGSIGVMGALRIAGTKPFVAQVRYLLESAGIEVSNINLEREDDEVRKPILRIYVNLDSAITKGFYFRCWRKQYRLEQFAKLRQLSWSYPIDLLSEMKGGIDYSKY